MAYKIQKTGRWAAQGRDATGKRIQLGTFATKREAKDVEAKHRRALPQSTTTVEEWRRHWLLTRSWKQSTQVYNAERTRAFAETHGKLKLAAVNRTLARKWIEEHPSTLTSLRAMFGAALYEDDEHGQALLTSNPFSRLVKRTVRRRDLQADWLSAEEVTALESNALGVVGPWAAAIVRFAAETGIRPGELWVVEHEDLDVEAGIANIRRAADSRTYTIGKPKNGQEREIVLSHAAAEAAGVGEGRVFSNPHGKQLWNNSWGYYWHQIRVAFGRPTMDFYELRHYAATRLLEAGLDYPDVAIQLGHTDGGALVRTVYGHPSRRQALERIRTALNQSSQED